MDVRIHEQNLPGIGHRYEVAVGDDRRLIVVVQHTGRIEVPISARGADEPAAAVALSHEEALGLAALLTGARFSIESDPEGDAHEATEPCRVGDRLVVVVARGDRLADVVREVVG